MFELITSRLHMRELSPETDAAFLVAVLNDPAFVRNVGDRGVRTETDGAAYIRDKISPSYRRHGFGMWLVELKDTGEPIGMCGLLKRETLMDVDLGFSLLEAFRSRGYAIEAAAACLEYGWAQARLGRIVAITAPHNASSIRLLEKLGMKFERKVRLTPESDELMLLAIERPLNARFPLQ